MTVREYLSKLPQSSQVTFVVQHSVKAAAGPFREYQYSTGSIRGVYDWLTFGPVFLDENLVINADHPPIDPTGLWIRDYKNGYLRCALITSPATLLEHYGQEQGQRMIEYYERTVK